MKKYELTDEIKEFNGKTLHRIRAIADFGSVKNGDLGGFVETENNLLHDNDSWIYHDACVCEKASVREFSFVRDHAVVLGNSIIAGRSIVGGCAVVCGNAWVSGESYIGAYAHVSGESFVCDNSTVVGYSIVKGNAHVNGNATLNRNAFITRSTDFITIGAIGSRNEFTTFFKNKDNGISVNCGCFNGSLEEFLDRVNEFHGDDKHGKSYRIAVELAKNQIQLA